MVRGSEVQKHYEPVHPDGEIEVYLGKGFEHLASAADTYRIGIVS